MTEDQTWCFFLKETWLKINAGPPYKRANRITRDLIRGFISYNLGLNFLFGYAHLDFSRMAGLDY